MFAANQYALYPESPYRFTHFRKTNGYANQPLDGIWLRAPYLHNGSVPTLRDLLEPPEQRPKVFYRGYDVFDQDGRRLRLERCRRQNGQTFFQYDTSIPATATADISTARRSGRRQAGARRVFEDFLTEAAWPAPGFKRVLWLGIVSNLALAVPTLLVPARMMA